LNEKEENIEEMKIVTKNYKNVYVIDFPYEPFQGEHWNTIQRISLSIGCNAFRKICRYIALIDADEFIRIEENKQIGDFLLRYNTTFSVQSNILTNKSNDDKIDNNILSICNYVGENKYTKVFLRTSEMSDNEFVISPHDHLSKITLEKKDIIHYHCWVNKRYSYQEGMAQIDLKKEMSIIRVTHNAGFFSCCSARLDSLIQYFNNNRRLPDIVDSTTQFSWYKCDKKDTDITFHYFHHYDYHGTIRYVTKIDYSQVYQFSDYSTIKYSDLNPFIQKYFSPSHEIKQLIEELKLKYSLSDFENICVLFYRGNDKITETELCTYDEYVVYAQKILNNNPNVRFFIQSDETEFIEKMTNLFPENSFFMKEEIRHINKCNNTVDKVFPNELDKYSKLYLAITIIMSMCKYIVCGSGNCSIWIMLYRGNVENVYQNIKGKWIDN
jgi:hypothetical protein